MQQDQRTNELSAIEKVLFLRGVEPFSSCRAEAVLRLASIAAERTFAAGEAIYAADDEADACYCLVEGSVSLAASPSSSRVVDAPTTLGLVEILSGRRRAETAIADADGARALVIEADDLFDLLSNQIEIVRSLFRALLPAKPPPR
jgi:CRP-like cAMP-binding protein